MELACAESDYGVNAVSTRTLVAELGVQVRVRSQRRQLVLPVRLLVFFPHIDLELEINEGESPILRLFLHSFCRRVGVVLYHSDYIHLGAINFLM